MREVDTYNKSQIAELPLKNGFRQRGMEMTRLETFADAAFAFANIMMFWYAHHKWSRRFGLEDTKSVFISLTLIFVTLIYVYPLKATYSGALEFFSNGYFESFFELKSFEDLRSLFVVFGTGYAALSATIALLYRHALAIISVVLSLTLPDHLVVVAGMIYGVFGVALLWHGLRRGRLRKTLL